jgi:hypothetical protein
VAYDPANEALVRALVTALDPQEGEAIVTLVVLRETASTPRGVEGTADFFLVDEGPQYRVLRLDEQGRYEVSVWADAQPQPLDPATRSDVGDYAQVLTRLRDVCQRELDRLA